MSDKAQKLGSSSSFARAGQARSARRQMIDAALGGGDPSDLPLHLLSHNPDNPRTAAGDVSGLAASLREVGLVQALTVSSVDAYLRSHPDRGGELEPGAQYVVVDGHRRLAAARDAGLASIRVVVDDARVSSDEKLLEAAYVANAQREDLSEIDEAHALKSLVDFYGSQSRAASRLGISQAVISQRLSLLHLSPELQADLQAGRRQVRHVRGLAKLSPQEQKSVADARAESAERDAQERQRRRQTGQSGETDLAPRPVAAAPSYNPVIGDRPDRASPAGGSDLFQEGGRQEQPGTAAGRKRASSAVPGSVEESTGGDLPWDEPERLNVWLRRNMSAEDRHTLAKLLAQD